MTLRGALPCRKPATLASLTNSLNLSLTPPTTASLSPPAFRHLHCRREGGRSHPSRSGIIRRERPISRARRCSRRVDGFPHSSKALAAPQDVVASSRVLPHTTMLESLAPLQPLVNGGR